MPAADKICESFTHNPLTRGQGNPTFLYLMGIHKECISNASKFDSDFEGGHNGCACVAMGEQKYILHLNTAFVPPRKPGRSPSYPLNPTHGYIVVTDQQYQNNVYDYHLVKNTNSALKKIVVADIPEQWIKGEKYTVIGYANKSFVEFMEFLYVWYGQIKPGDLMQNKEDARDV